MGTFTIGEVSARTDVVVAGEGAGSKLDKAVVLGVPVLASDRFEALLAEGLAAVSK